MSELRVTKLGAVIPVVVDEAGRLHCPDLGCDELMVEVEPGQYMCPVTIATSEMLAGMASRLELRVEGLFN